MEEGRLSPLVMEELMMALTFFKFLLSCQFAKIKNLGSMELTIRRKQNAHQPKGNSRAEKMGFFPFRVERLSASFMGFA
jgi:hypothetical protein